VTNEMISAVKTSRSAYLLHFEQQKTEENRLKETADVKQKEANKRRSERSLDDEFETAM
jgi:hypothetical protein